MQNINTKKNPKKNKEDRRIRNPIEPTMVQFNRKSRRSLDAWARKNHYVPRIK
jgi:hypothetical protein